MKCIRDADQFIHTGLEKADQAHQEAHSLLERWEKFALKLDERRKLLAIVVSFYKQTEEASERLLQIEKEIQIEREKLKNFNENKETNTRKSSESSSSKSSAKYSDLTNQLAEISGPGLREGRIVLEKITKDDYKDDFQAEHVIKRVYEFTEQVKDLKSKLVSLSETVNY
jgi:hypothetical protein